MHHKFPIYSLPMLSGQTYVVTSPALASLIQRASTTLLFEPIIVPVSSRMAGFSKATTKILYDYVDAEGIVRPGFMARMHECLYSLMGPTEIKYQGRIVLERLTSVINALPNTCEKELFEWGRETFTDVTTFAFFGPENPFALSPSFLKDYWIWEHDMIGTIASPLPQLTHRRAYLARERMVASFLEYLQKERHKKASPVIQERIRIHEEAGVSIQDRARSEWVMNFGLLVNGAITVFWMLDYIFAQPQLLEELRQEIGLGAYQVDRDSNTAIITFKELQSSCPLLNSVFKESLRLIAPMTSARFVMKDTVVADTWLLRANSVVQLAGGVMHEDPTIWGPDASDFNAYRFIRSTYGTKTGATDSDKVTVHPAAWRGFGGGTVYCPGRHFAQIEILTLVAVLIMGWDLKPPKGQDSIAHHPPKDWYRIPIGVMKPLRDVKVSMERRKDMESLNWVLKLD
jgi:cytochrome P450